MKVKFFLICIMAFTIFICSSCSSNSSTASNETSEPEYKNPYMIEQMKEALYSSDYTKVEQLGEEIKSLYPDSKDALMADSYLKVAENMKSAAEEKVANIDFKDYIQIYSIKTSRPNTAGGIDLYIKWKNTSENIIKYATFECELYNAVDDRVSDDISNDYIFRGLVTGPIKPGQSYGSNEYWSNAWWNHSGKYAKIIGIELEYMNGEIIEIPSSRIDELFY